MGKKGMVMKEMTENIYVPLKIPEDAEIRSRIRQGAYSYSIDNSLSWPIGVEKLREHGALLLNSLGLKDSYLDYTALMLGNGIWADEIASIPFEKRIFLIPQCLRPRDVCPAEFDEIGLLCESCGRCVIGELQDEAESLGYGILVAEGSTTAQTLISKGKVYGVIGVACLSSLEESFKKMHQYGVPGLAIPLLIDGCTDTVVDVEEVRQMLYLTSDYLKKPEFFAIKEEVRGWFQEGTISHLINRDNSPVEKTALSWLTKAGKRWRPILLVMIYRNLVSDQEADQEAEKKLAVAVECFHKASLIHDDIEDEDDSRYGEKTLHRIIGTGRALNCGDFLIGEGYRLISDTLFSSEIQAAMHKKAASCHRQLCLGQGEELTLLESGSIPSPEQILRIFTLKTSPAFSVAFILGGIAGGAEKELLSLLDEFSIRLGIAYQIRDDLDDYENELESSSRELQISVLTVLAYTSASVADREFMEMYLQGLTTDIQHWKNIIKESRAHKQADSLMEENRQAAVDIVNKISNRDIRLLLHRLLGGIFSGA